MTLNECVQYSAEQFVHIISNGATGQSGIMGNSASLAFPRVGHTQTPLAFASIRLFFCLCRMPVNVQLCTFATCHENYSMTLNLSVNHSSKQTTERNARTARKLLFTCLVTARPLIDLGGPRAAQGRCNMAGIRYLLFQSQSDL